jgi:hypothetical protein
MSVNCFAATYYVSSTGKDTNSGTNENTPFQTLDKANIVMSDGDTISLKRGDIWLITANLSNGNDVGVGLYIRADNVTIGAYGSGAKPIIDATDKTDRNEKRGIQYYCPIQVGKLYATDSENVTIKDLDLRGPALGCSIYAYDCGNNLTISNCDFQGAGWGTDSGECLIIAGSGENKITLENCFFDQFTGNNVGYSKSIEIRGGNGHVIRGNTFYGYGFGGALRFSDHGTGAIVEKNFFYGPDYNATAAWAMVIRSCDGGVYIVRNNVFDMTNHGGFTTTTQLRGIASWFDYSSTTRLIYNNTFISSGGHGAAVEGMGGNAENIVNMYNNIVVGVDVGFNNDSSNLHLRNNIFYNCDNITEDGLEGTNQNSIVTNPYITNVSMSNHKATDAMLTNESTNAINSGFSDSAYLPNEDYSENIRSNIDIGAFELIDGFESPQLPGIPPNLHTTEQ